jgi:predicted transcriptional regulator
MRTPHHRAPDVPFYLAQVLAEHGMTLRELTARTGIPYLRLLRLVQPDADPRWSTLLKIAEALEMEVDEFADYVVSIHRYTEDVTEGGC